MPEKNFTQRFGYEQELKRSLDFWDLLIYGIIFMVPIAPFGIYGFVAQNSKGMVPLVYLVGMICMLFTALSYAKLSEEFPIAGSIYSYAQRGINEHIGFFAGWLILLDYMLIPSLLYLVSATALHNLLPKIPIFVWLILFVGVNTIINILGIDITAKTNKLIVLIELAILFIFIIVGVIVIFKNNTLEFSFKPIYNRDNFNLTFIMSAASIAVLSFLGFDAISTLSEEAKSNRNIVGNAIIFSILAVGTMFVIQTWIAALIVPDYKSFNSIDGAFYEIALRAGGKAFQGLSIIATAFAWGIANTLVAQAAISRILFSMARDKKLPTLLAKIHPRFKTPYISTILVALISLVISASSETKIDELAALVNFGALSAFLVLHLTVINYFIIKRKSQDYINHLLLPLIGFMIIIYVWISLSETAKKLGFIWICIGIIYMIVMKLQCKEQELS